MSKKATILLPQTQEILNQMGEQIRLARLRRHLSAELVAERAGISRMTLSNIEKGSASVAIGSYSTSGDYLISLPAKRSLFTAPGETVMFADHAGVSSTTGRYEEQIDLFAPRGLTLDQDAGWDAAPTMHFRHSGKVNVCWVDGHVSANGPLSYRQSGWSRSADVLAEQFKIGWFGGNKSDCLKLFKVRK